MASASSNRICLIRSGVYTEKNCNQNIVGYHAMTVVGYGTLNGIPYWVRYNWLNYELNLNN